MKKKLITDYYRLNNPQKNSSIIEAILNKLIGMRINKRNIEFTEKTVRIQSLVISSQGIFEGNYIKIRMVGLPSKASKTGEVTTFDLEDNEGMGEEAAFLYDSTTNILAIQRNRYSFTINSFAYYLNKFNTSNDDIEFLPIISENTLDRLSNLESITKFQLKVSGISNPTHFKNSGLAPGKVIDLLEEFEAPQLSLEISSGYTKNSLKKSSINRAINQFLKFANLNSENVSPSEVTSLLVTGTDLEEKKDIIDLIADRVFSEQDIDISVKQRSIPYPTRRKVLRDHFENILPIFKRRFY